MARLSTSCALNDKFKLESTIQCVNPLSPSYHFAPGVDLASLQGTCGWCCALAPAFVRWFFGRVHRIRSIGGPHDQPFTSCRGKQLSMGSRRLRQLVPQRLVMRSRRQLGRRPSRSSRQLGRLSSRPGTGRWRRQRKQRREQR